MSRQIKGLLYFFITDVRYSLMIFWTILLSVLVLSLAVAFFLTDIEGGEFYFGFPFGIYIYCGILGFLTVKESIPFSLKVGATRKNLFISIGIFFLMLSLAKALFANSLHSVTLLFTKSTGIDTFAFIHPAMLLQDTWFNRVIIDTAIMFLLLTLMFILGLFFYKYGLAGGGAVTGAIAVLLLAGIAQGWIFDFLTALFSDISLSFFYQLLAVGVLVYCISFVFLRKITIVKTK